MKITSDSFNPVLIKELRQHFHGKLFLITMGLLLLAQLAALFLIYGNMETAEPSIGAYTALREYVVHIHLKDWKIYDSPRRDALPKRTGKYFANAVIGEGDLPLREFWDTLDAKGRELYVNMETGDFYRTSSTAAVLKRVSDMLRNW